MCLLGEFFNTIYKSVNRLLSRYNNDSFNYDSNNIFLKHTIVYHFISRRHLLYTQIIVTDWVNTFPEYISE